MDIPLTLLHDVFRQEIREEVLVKEDMDVSSQLLLPSVAIGTLSL